MKSRIEKLPYGAPFVIGQTIVQLLKSATELAGAKVIDNPRRASELDAGQRIVFFEDQHDKFIDKPGQVAKRTYTFTLGVINRSTQARQGAHADYRTSKMILLSSIPEIAGAIELVNSGLIEKDVTFQLENIDVGGALVIGTFSIDYRDQI